MSAPGVFIKTFGCQMNEYDSEKVFALLEETHQPVSSPEEAEVIFVNTCSVREKAASKLFSLLGTFRELKQTRPNLVIGVGGCVAQQEGREILRRSDLVDFVVGTHNISLVPSLIGAAKSGLPKQVAVDYRDEWEDLPAVFQSRSIQAKNEAASSSAFYSSVRAMVAIQRGCNKRCSFCVVPTTRGPEVSRSEEEILREISLKVKLGAREVMLLGQTVNSWGRDLHPRRKFEELIRAIADIPDLQRIRFTSPHPADVRPTFIKLFQEIPALCPHIHLPLQSGSDRILRLMNRNYRKKRYLEIVDALRQEVADIALSTDIIVGFPTETDAEFQETLEVVKQVAYNFSFSFMYSERPNTTAQQMGGDIPLGVKKQRLQELQALQDKLSLRHNQRLLDKDIAVLIETIARDDAKTGRGRSLYHHPVEVTAGEDLKVGQIVQCTVKRAGAHGLGAELSNA